MDNTTFLQRRQRLLTALPPGSIALIYAGHEHIRNRDTHYPFRPDSNFFYLSGFDEPEAVLLLSKPHQQPAKTHLWLRRKDTEKEIWDGYRLGVEAAPTALAIDSAAAIEQLDEQLVDWLAQHSSIYISFEQHDFWWHKIMSAITQLKRRVRLGIEAPTNLQDLDTILHEQRLIKDEAAQAGLRQAAQITVAGHLAAMQAAKKARYEYEVQAALEANFVAQGAEMLAFPSIVASGHHACILHYQHNHAPIQNNQLILIDAGAQWQGYAGDCTHTFPVSGRFTDEQACIYRLVLSAQQTAKALVKSGTSFNDIHLAAVRVISEGLLNLGLIQADSVDTVVDQGLYKSFYMHQTGHWLGCDVHDVGQYKQQGQWRTLVEGMVLTVEPGIYIAVDNLTVDPCWRGIGIRIEDTLLVTHDGYECLTAGLPRTVEEIEAWMQAH